MDLVEVVPGLHLLRFAVGNAYLWADDDGLTLVDCGTPGAAGEIAGAIASLGRRVDEVRRLVLTHCHVDHVGGAAEIATWGAVEVCAHRDDAAVIRGDAVAPDPVLSDWERELLARVQGGMPAEAAAPVRIDRELVGGEVLDFGGGARVVAVPGHTPGSIAVHLPEFGVLFTGDTIARRVDGTVMLGVFNSDPVRAAASLAVQADLAPDVACFGHGEPVAGGAAALLRAAMPG